ncbi:hypothetical protein DM02DRAFT_613246 [Periconia macrospinosa]|uniref:Uncharacterized protein n=1 Tax=Periconia macrospinosa TaxID=97972 RepID=A0A2V1DYW2_9PLEO|nr:hypothetical protein DM02DRAFT_613246 [Periconia macrospinosa]
MPKLLIFLVSANYSKPIQIQRDIPPILSNRFNVTPGYITSPTHEQVKDIPTDFQKCHHKCIKQERSNMRCE